MNHLEQSPRGHFRLHVHAAIFRLHRFLHRIGAAEETLEQFPFLKGYLDELRPHLPPGLTFTESDRWWATTITGWEEAYAGAPLPLTPLPLDLSGRLALLLAGLPEEDSRFGTLFGYLQGPLGQRRPTAELISRVLESDGVVRPLLALGLLDTVNPGAPRSEWELAVPGPIWDLIRGDERESAALPSLADLILPEHVRVQVEALPAAMRAGKVRTVVLRGSRGSERLAVAGALARSLGLGLQEAEASGVQQARLGPICAMTRSMPVIRCEPGPGETVTLPDLPGYSGPVALVMGFEGGLAGPLTEAGAAVTVSLPPPDRALRRRCWQAALGDGAPTGAELDAIAERYHLPGGYIRQAGALALAGAALQGRERVTARDVQEAARSLNRQALDALAVRLEPKGSWDGLVVGEATMARLLELERRCRHRERLLEELGPSYETRANRGVRALLAGPSGTGKTLAARTLAAVLGMEIYRVDLAAVVNKYIGETEKNLNQVLSRAEELDVILLLDEGDALMAKRSDVRSANDRYANLETNYLLQRLEQYQGIILITTNAGELIDSAFKRRMDLSVDFQPPQGQERYQIWQLHLPAPNGIDPADLETVAVRCELNGGQIRNAAMHAALLAMDDGGRLERRHLEAAVQSEYRKAGAICPLGEPGVERPAVRGMHGFIKAVRRGGSGGAGGQAEA